MFKNLELHKPIFRFIQQKPQMDETQGCVKAGIPYLLLKAKGKRNVQGRRKRTSFNIIGGFRDRNLVRVGRSWMLYSNGKRKEMSV